MDKTEQELADQQLAEKVEAMAEQYPQVSSTSTLLRYVALSLRQENAKLTEQRDEWEATAVERQQLCDHWAERATEKDARIKELETALAKILSGRFGPFGVDKIARDVMAKGGSQ